MNFFIKNILKRTGIYHPLQSSYRNIIFSLANKKYRKAYRRYKGSGYTCNSCGAMYQKFVPDHPAPENKTAIDKNQVIAGYGENMLCPNCMSTARERLVIAWLTDEVQLEGKTVLHLSPEKNIYGFLEKKATVITADLEPGFYKMVDGLVQKQDATRLGFADNRFDLLIANHILEHIPDDRKAIAEIYRVLKPAAMAVLQVPFSETIPHTLEEPSIHNPARQAALFGQKDHVRIYALNDYLNRLREAGFLVEVSGAVELEKYLKFAIQPGEKFFKIVKK